VRRDGSWEVGTSHITDEAGERVPADPVEGRRSRLTESSQRKMVGTSSPTDVSTKLRRVAELARESPQMVFTTLAHLIDEEFLHEAYRRTRKDGAVGVDGETAKAYAVDLQSNLKNLLDRFKSGRYHAPPVRRVHIAKADGVNTRPIGKPTFEDKVLQRAVTMLLDAVYEQDFSDCSYAFRRGRSAHQALDALWRGAMSMGGGWVLEVDIESFFDTMSHSRLREFLDKRMRDGVVRRAIDKWLKAGVMEGEITSRPEVGVPQGGVVSPLLSNLYLHEVLDQWFEQEVRPRLAGRAVLIRFADDATMVFANEADARRVMDVLPKRFGKYGLRLHPDKTRLVDFRRPRNGSALDGTPGTFDLLGFRHYWGRSRKGQWVVRRKTSPKRLSRAHKRMNLWCRNHRHLKLVDQHALLVRKLRGHYAYFGITGNTRAISSFWQATKRMWRKWLGRRGQSRPLQWERYVQVLQRYPLPPPRIVHRLPARAASP
jgi:RNA-directed DNA polymerase